MAEPAMKDTISRAQAMLRAGDRNGALKLLAEAAAAEPGNHDLQLNLAMAQRAAGNLMGSLAALNDALAADPYSFLAHLSKGAVLEQLDKPRLAADVYRNALRIAPPDANTPQSLKAPIARARELVAEQAQALASHLHDSLADLRGSESTSDMRRFDESVDVLAGVTRVFDAEPVQLHYPRLPAIPFFDRSYFPWMEQLEASTDVIREELVTLLEQGLPGFSPYVQYARGTPENQFAPLNHNDRWSSLWLWKDGVRQDEAVARCPKTAAILEDLPLSDQPGFAPTALFSALAPKTKIPPHTGSTNTRLLVHLPLVLPGPAGFRVGNETREWAIGEAWAFDDTIEHEAWNDADETRVIMIFDIWNPLLSEEEKALVRELLIANRDWRQT